MAPRAVLYYISRNLIPAILPKSGPGEQMPKSSERVGERIKLKKK
jgi:hypothetical protein